MGEAKTLQWMLSVICIYCYYRFTLSDWLLRRRSSRHYQRERERERERAVIAARALRRVWPKWNGSDVTGRRVGSASTCIIVQYIARLWRHFSAGNVSAAIISCMFLSIDHTQCWSAPVYSTALLLIYQTNEMIAYRNLPVRTFH